ncbi:hypothetical protein [Flagellimonas onchidii]|uniref:hypothetical protein n=1 Tax=Flagellimonas onchidii TaxID=2562684 RepID=UPI0010A6ADEB|nr:hypothetical protein [Allomuricauda onchidii]
MRNKKTYFLLLLLSAMYCEAQKMILTKDDLLYQSTSENLDRFGSFIWSKSDDGTIIINQENLDIIKVRKGMYYKSLVKYSSFLGRTSYHIQHVKFSERARILAYLISHIKRNDIEPKIIIHTVIGDKDSCYYHEFEKNNYYDLFDLKDEYRKEFERLRPPEKLELPYATPIIDADYMEDSRCK